MGNGLRNIYIGFCVDTIHPSCIINILLGTLGNARHRLNRFARICTRRKEAGLVDKGDTVVLTAGVPLGISGNTNMIRVVEVG